MKKEMLVGALFLLAVCLATFAAIVLSGADFFRPKTTWTVELDNLGGLEEENDVRVLGHRMGTVESIQFDRQKYKFKVFLKMFADAPIHEGYRISVREASAFGEKYLAVDPGPPGKPRADVTRLIAEPTSADMLGEASDALAEVKKAVEAINQRKGTVGKLIYDDDVQRSLKESAESLRKIVSRVEQGRGVLGRLINEDEIYRQLREVVDKLNNGNNALAKLMQDDSGAIVDDLRSASSGIKAIIAKANEGSGTLAKLLNDDRLYQNTSQAVATANDVMQDVRHGKGVASMLISDDEARRNVSDALKNLFAVSEDIKNGNGTFGKLLTHDELYDNFNTFAKNISSASAKVNEGEGTVAKLLNDPDIHDKVKRLLARAIDTIENARDSAPITTVISFITGPFQ